jgi:hypothetical protein
MQPKKGYVIEPVFVISRKKRAALTCKSVFTTCQCLWDLGAKVTKTEI